METDKHLLKIIQTSCKGEKLQAALDAALLLTQPASLDAAAKIAGFFDLPGLQERIVLVKESKSGRREAEDENKRGGKWAHLVDDRTVPSINTIRHANGATGNGMFSNADDSYASPRSSFVSTAPFGTARKLFTPAPSRRTQVEPEEGSEVGEGEEMLVDEEEEDGEDEGAVVRKRSRSVSDEGEEAGYVEEPEEMEGDMEAPESIPQKGTSLFPPLSKPQ
jgi:chromosome transmission fidelity protein 4